MADIYLSKWTGAEIDNAIEKTSSIDTNITEKTNTLVSDLAIAENVLTVTKNSGDSESYDLPINNSVVIHFTYDSTTSVYVPETGYEIADVINEIKNGKVVIFIINNHAYYAFEYSTDESNLWINGMDRVGVYSNSATDPWIGTSYYQWSAALGGAQNSTYNTVLSKATTTTGGLLTATDKVKLDSLSNLTKPVRLYYNATGTESNITMSAEIPSNALVLVMVRRDANYNFITTSIGDSNLTSLDVCSRPSGNTGAPIYRHCSWSGTTFSVGSMFFGYGVSGTPSSGQCKICAIYYIPYST